MSVTIETIEKLHILASLAPGSSTTLVYNRASDELSKANSTQCFITPR